MPSGEALALTKVALQLNYPFWGNTNTLAHTCTHGMLSMLNVTQLRATVQCLTSHDWQLQYSQKKNSPINKSRSSYPILLLPEIYYVLTNDHLCWSDNWRIYE